MMPSGSESVCEARDFAPMLLVRRSLPALSLQDIQDSSVYDGIVFGTEHREIGGVERLLRLMAVS